jgi:hypothetical protein
MGAFEKEGVDIPSVLIGWMVLSSLRFRVEKDIPCLKKWSKIISIQLGLP